MKCEITGRWKKAASRCYSRRCPSCGILWAGDARVKMMRNVDAYGGDVAVVTITAPGKDRLHHDPAGCVLEDQAHDWNTLAPANWRELHRQALNATNRHLRRLQRDERAPVDARFRLVAKAWEFQRRGVLHVHVVVGMATGWEQELAAVYVSALDGLRRRYDFGYVDKGKRTAENRWRRGLVVIPAERAGRYLAKYLAGVKAGKMTITETVTHRDVPPHVIYNGRHLTRRTRCTMRTLRVRRYAYALYTRAVDLGLDPDAMLADHGRPDADDDAVIDLLRDLLPHGP